MREQPFLDGDWMRHDGPTPRKRSVRKGPGFREEWKPCPGYETLYEVSSAGRVRRHKDAVRGPRTFPGRIKKLGKRPDDGRPVVTLHSGVSRLKGRKRLPVAPLIARAFLGPPPKAGDVVGHLDGNVKNNQAANLRWQARGEVLDRGYKQGRRQYAGIVLSALDAEAIVARHGEATAAALASEFDVSEKTIQDIWAGRTHADGRAGE